MAQNKNLMRLILIILTTLFQYHFRDYYIEHASLPEQPLCRARYAGGNEKHHGPKARQCSRVW